MKYCKVCGAEIMWALTKRGMRIPCDPGIRTYWKNPKGTARILTLQGYTISCDLDGDIAEATGIGYVPHRETCTDPDAFRRSI